jgi:hypothetical protein
LLYIFRNIQVILLPHSLGITLIGLNKAHIVLPDIEDLLSLDEQSLLQRQPNSSATLHKLDTIMHRATTLTHQPELDVSRILEALKTEKQEETSTSMWPIILSIVICILILVIGYYNRHYLKTLKGKMDQSAHHFTT